MSGDDQLDKVTKTINVGGFDKLAVINRPQILARPLGARQFTLNDKIIA